MIDLKKFVTIGGMFVGSVCHASQEAMHFFTQPVEPDVLLKLGDPYVKNMVDAALGLLAKPEFIARLMQQEDGGKQIFSRLRGAIQIFSQLNSSEPDAVSIVREMRLGNGEKLVNETTPNELQASLARIRDLYNDPSTSRWDKSVFKRLCSIRGGFNAQ
jgi:hypothetical protein